MKRFLSFLLLLLTALAGAAAEMNICPPWEVTVVDQDGKPIPGCSVLQIWGCNFREEFIGDNATVKTDDKGQATFPARSLTPPSTPIWKKAWRKVDGKGGPDPTTSLHVSHPGYQTVWIQSRRDPRVSAVRDGLRTRIVLEREKP